MGLLWIGHIVRAPALPRTVRFHTPRDKTRRGPMSVPAPTHEPSSRTMNPSTHLFPGASSNHSPRLQVDNAIMCQAEEILVKPIDKRALVNESRLLGGPSGIGQIESVANILGRKTDLAIQTWYEHIRGDELLMSISMDHEERCGHLPAVFRDLVCRLKSANPIGRKMPISWDAAKHGLHRRRQGYSAVMLVEESRMLQISIFPILQQDLDTIDFSVLLNGMMVITDEIASQLSQAMTSFTLPSPTRP